MNESEFRTLSAAVPAASAADEHCPVRRRLLLAALATAVAGPLQAMTDGRLDSAILRQLLIALAMIVIMLLRPRGLWPAPEHGKSLTQKT